MSERRDTIFNQPVREMFTIEEFCFALSSFKAWFGMEAAIKREDNKIVAALPPDVDFNQFWLKPTRHDQFFIKIENVPEEFILFFTSKKVLEMPVTYPEYYKFTPKELMEEIVKYFNEVKS